MRSILLPLCFLLLCGLIHTKYPDYSDHGQSWEECIAQDGQQSPIDLPSNPNFNNYSYLFANFKSVSLGGNFNETTVYLKTSQFTTTQFGQLYTMTSDGKAAPFRVTQARIRCHSEHSIDGEYFDLELQLFSTELYSSSQNLRLAIALLFKIGADNDPFLGSIIAQYNEATPNFTLKADLSYLLDNSLQLFDYWSYLGSATIPPCFAEKLYWVVPNRVYSLTEQQHSFFFKMFNGEKQPDGNWRSRQQLKEGRLAYHRAEVEVEM